MSFPFGVTYYPDQWPMETWDKTFAEIKKAGFNLVRFGEMAWDWLEPQPGKFHFAELDHAMNLCAKHGLKVLLGIPTSQVPPWFHRKYKNSRPVAQDGTLYPDYGPRPNICKDNLPYRKQAETMTKKLAARYKYHPALFLWQVDNEPVYPPLDHTTSNDFCHCPHSRQAFIAWAKQRYGSLKRLNEVWGTKFWTNTFSSFEDITTPKAGMWEAVSPHIFLDWFRFKTDRIKAWVSPLARIVKQIDPHHKVGTNGFIGICTRVPEHASIPENLDWYGLDVYPKGNQMREVDYAFALDLWRSFTRGTHAEFHITELQGGQNVRWGNPAYVEGPEMKKWTELALEHGAQCLLFHLWRPPLFGAETGGFGILQQDGSSTKRLETIKQIADKIQRSKIKDQNKSKILNPKTAIAYLRSSEVQSYQEQGPPRSIAGQWETVRTDIGLLHTLLSIQGAYQALYKKGQWLDFIFERDLDRGDFPYKVILLPNAYLLSKKQYNHLKQWVENGGTLMTDARFGLKDESGHLYKHPLLEDLLAVKYGYTTTTSEGFLDVLKGKPNKMQIITRKLGRGKAHYANFSLFLALKKGSKRWLPSFKKLVSI